MFGPNALNIIKSLRYARLPNPKIGVREDFDIPLGAWRLGTLATITTATEPLYAATLTSYRVISYTAAGAAANNIAYSGTVPRDFVSTATKYLKLRIAARKVDSGADENPDLGLTCNLIWMTPTSTSLLSLTTPASSGVLAAATDGTTANFAWYTFDLGARLAAESKTLSPGDLFRLSVAPDDTVGTTDMTLQIAGTHLVWERHATYIDRTLIDAT